MDGGNAKGLSGTILACSNNLKIIHLLGTIYGKKPPFDLIVVRFLLLWSILTPIVLIKKSVPFYSLIL